MVSETSRSEATPVALWHRPGVRQLVKFCIVGASSTVIDKGSQFAMLSAVEKWAPTIPWWICSVASFCLGVTNGYFWNRRWTFQAISASSGTQYAKFIFTNIIGLGLNLAFTKLFLVALTGQMTHPENPDKMHVILASLCAVPIVVIWNFSAAKFWTFRPHKNAEQ